jgi:hypothetical protein
MKNKYKVTLSILTLLLTIAFGYYFASPKAIIENLSSNKYDEFIISLPTSRISFSPINAHSSNTILYSRQGGPGIGTYSLVANNSEIIGSDFSYAEGNEFGRVLRFTIKSDGQLSVGE